MSGSQGQTLRKLPGNHTEGLISMMKKTEPYTRAAGMPQAALRKQRKLKRIVK